MVLEVRVRVPAAQFRFPWMVIARVALLKVPLLLKFPNRMADPVAVRLAPVCTVVEPDAEAAADRSAVRVQPLMRVKVDAPFAIVTVPTPVMVLKLPGQVILELLPEVKDRFCPVRVSWVVELRTRFWRRVSRAEAVVVLTYAAAKVTPFTVTPVSMVEAQLGAQLLLKVRSSAVPSAPLGVQLALVDHLPSRVEPFQVRAVPNTGGPRSSSAVMTLRITAAQSP